MTEVRDIVIVGGGLAAAKAAEAVRAEGFVGAVTLFGDEPVRPYERPPLSKKFLRGDAAEDEVYVHPPAFYDDHAIELRLGERVDELDLAAGEVVTAAGARRRFDRLLLATGAAPRRLPDGGLAGVHVLRTLDDSRRLRDDLARVAHVTIVGGGWIGCEVAAAARALGADVTLVDPLEFPLQRVLGTEVGVVFRDLHAEHRVDLRLGVGVAGLHGRELVEAVELSDGRNVATELVVVGIGVQPGVQLAERAGLAVGDGVLVDARLTSSDPRVLAAGDVARAEHLILDTSIRVDHWANALNQGTAAGRNLVGRGEVYDRIPYFYSDQYDLGLEYSGHAQDWDRVVFRGDVAAREFIAFWLHDDRVVAGMNVNVWDVVDDIQALVRSGARVDPARLVDPEVALADLAGAHA